ncbi:MAG: hypothetical protein HYX69_10975 [Planctomycetia bacterium]|nr:hypothetical protein [Planctomycetia bacterium]
MKRLRTGFPITRRRFAFWVGFGLFNLGEVLRADVLDDLAAASMRAAEPATPQEPGSTPEHWTLAENNSWVWFERENLVDGRWKLTGITAPVHKQTGERYTGHSGYLDDDLVPAAVRHGEQRASAGPATGGAIEDDAGQPNAMRRARHGRPPSRWLRSLNADELRIWLVTIDVPEAGVSGMTYWEHLTRDHSFDSARIAGLAEDEQAKLHAAAHYGY